MKKPFKVGDRVRFIRRNSCGGEKYGFKDDLGTVTIVTMGAGNRWVVRMKVDVIRSGGLTYVNAYDEDLELDYQEIQYDPKQQADMDDDI